MQRAMMTVVCAAFSSTAAAVPLTVVEVSPADLNYVFGPLSWVTATDMTEAIPLGAGSATGVLRSRVFVGLPGSATEGLSGYAYRIDLTGFDSDSAGPCIDRLTIDFGTALSLDYNGDGALERVFVVTRGSVGSVGPTSADKQGSRITFRFEEAICPGESSFFFGMASRGLPRVRTAEVAELISGRVVENSALGGPGPPGGCLPRPDLNDDLTGSQQETLADLIQDFITAAVVDTHLTTPGIHGTLYFLPFHREYLNDLENFLISNGHAEFVPLPKWDPAKPIPAAFTAIDADCFGEHPQACAPLVDTTPQIALPSHLDFPGVCDNYDTTDLLSVGPPFPGLESWHNPIHTTVAGSMKTFSSPAAVIFWPWHAFIDDVWRTWQCCIISGLVFPLEPPPGCAVEPCWGLWLGLDDPFMLDSSGLTTNDRRGFHNTGLILGGVTAIPGMVGGAMAFDGVDGHIRVPDHPELNVGTSDLSIDAWVRTSAGGFQPLLEKREIGSAGYGLFLVDGHPGFLLSDGLASASFIATAGPDVADGQWHHVAVTVDRDAPGRLYVDSIPVLVFDPTSVSGDVSNNADLLLARTTDDPAVPAAFFTGDLDEVDCFRFVLSEEEVDGIFSAGPGGKFGSLAGFDPIVPGPCLEDLRQLVINVGLITGRNVTSLLVKVDIAIERLADGNVAGAIRILVALRNQAHGLANNGAYERGGFESIAHKTEQCLLELRAIASATNLR